MGRPRSAIPAAIVALATLHAAPAREASAVRKYFTQPGFQWTCEGKSPFRYCYPSGLQPAIAELKRNAQESLARSLQLTGMTNYSDKPRIYIFVLVSDSDLKRFMNVDAYGASEPRDHAVFFVWGHPDALTHELNHEILTTLWGPAEPWIAEGFAAYAAGPNDVDAQVRKLIGRQKYLPLANLVDPEWNASVYPAGQIYPELGSFVRYLYQSYGMARLNQVWRGGCESLERTLGKPLAQLEQEWLAALKGTN